MHFIDLVLHGRQRAQLLDVVFRQQGTSKDTHHFIDVAVQVDIVLNVTSGGQFSVSTRGLILGWRGHLMERSILTK